MSDGLGQHVTSLTLPQFDDVQQVGSLLSYVKFNFVTRETNSAATGRLRISDTVHPVAMLCQASSSANLYHFCAESFPDHGR